MSNPQSCVVNGTLDRNAFAAQLDAEMARLKALMLEEWGHCPNVQVDVEVALIVRANFNIKGFAHKGRKLIITPSNVKKARKPHLVARQICQEITTHRNTCADCGDGIAPIWSRARGGHAYSYSGVGVPEGFIEGYDRDPETGKVRNPLLMLNVPPDKVEMALHPIKAREEARRIAQLPPEKRQTYRKPTCPV